MSKQKTSLAPIISTIIVAALALAVAIFAIVLITGDDGQANTSGNNDSNVSAPYTPTEELVNECTYAAHDLVAANYKVVRLYITEGLSHLDEPYGNIPEDGYYTVDDSEYTSLEQLEQLEESDEPPVGICRVEL